MSLQGSFNFESSDTTSTTLPPMLAQYLDYKKKYSDCLVLMQVGDFYEAFYEDAVTASKALNLTLTSRSKINPVPMSGVPVAAIDSYLDRLVSNGFSVALISQQIDFVGKGMVPRKLERIVTPSLKVLGADNEVGTIKTSFLTTVYFENLEQNKNSLHLVYALAFSDFQTGKVFVKSGRGAQELINDIRSLAPAELILPKLVNKFKLDNRQTWVKELTKFSQTTKFRNLLAVNNKINSVKGLQQLAPLELKACKMLLEFLEETLVSDNLPELVIKKFIPDQFLYIDHGSRENLDLIKNLKTGNKALSLYGLLDHTITSGGSKLLKNWILAPSININEIKSRQAAVQFLKKNFSIRESLRENFKLVANLERIIMRLELNIVSPNELGAIRETLVVLPKIKELLRCSTAPEKIANLEKALVFNISIFSLLNNSLADDLPPSIKSGDVFKAGFNNELDELRNLKQGGAQYILDLELKEKTRTGINSLKIKYNNVLGYYYEVTKANLNRVPEYFIIKQQTINSNRYFTDQLKATEQRVLGAKMKMLALERELFEDFKFKLKPFVLELRALSETLSEIDVLQAFAHLADQENYICPDLNNDQEIVIRLGKHPVLASNLGSAFVANDLELVPGVSELLIITGANMGGKSTYLRQAALLVIMAQIGSFLPVQFAKIGIVDKIFARLGSSDDISEGESTFMVEMRETSSILAGASAKSLVLIDEVGRGTATRDGLAIAQAVLEWLHNNIKCKTLFATHFHELTELEKQHKKIKNYSVDSIDQDKKVIFTHKIIPGAANKSYGLEVAKLAGLPEDLIARAQSLLNINE